MIRKLSKIINNPKRKLSWSNKMRLVTKSVKEVAVLFSNRELVEFLELKVNPDMRLQD